MSEIEKIKEDFVKTGVVSNLDFLKDVLRQSEGPDAMLAYRLLRIHEKMPDMNDNETQTLLRRKNQVVLDSHFTDLSKRALERITRTPSPQ